MGGGGKEETYSDLNAEAIFNTNDNLYTKEMVRLFATYKRIDPVNFTKDMITSSRKYFSPQVFEALGVGVKNTAAVTVVTTNGVYNYVEEKTAQDNLVLYYYGSNDKEDKAIKLDAYKIRDFLVNNYEVDESFSRTFIDSIDMKLQDINGNVCSNITGRNVYCDLHPGCGDYDTVDITTETFAYRLTSDKWYSVKDGIISIDSLTDQWTTIMVELDENWVETTNEVELTISEDFRPLNICRAAYTTANDCTSWIELDPFVYYKEDIISEYADAVFFVFPMKHDFEFVENPDYQDVLLADMGLNNGDLEDALSDNRIKESFISYSVNPSYAAFRDQLADIYGTAGTGYNTVQLNTTYYDISYYGSYDPNGEYTSMNVSINGGKFHVENKDLIMVPVDVIQEFTMPEMYEFIKDIFRIWANVEETVKLKWYQTGFFKMVVFAATIIFALATGQYYLIGLAIGFKIGMELLSEVLTPEVMLVIGVIVAFTTGDMSSVTNGIALIGNVVNQAGGYFIKHEAIAIKGKITDVNKETAELNNAFAEMQKDPIYITSGENIDSYYRLSYGEVMYGAYDSIYDAMYNFDNMLNPNAGVRI
jgi:hypothetical protein